MIHFENAAAEDAAKLTEIQIRAFHSQNPPDMPNLTGPTGYDSAAWQMEMMHQALYIKILQAGEIVGGIVLTPEGTKHCHVERIYLDPPFHGQGIGTQAFAWLEKTYDQYKRWTLRTPAFHLRNQRFYERLGYVKTGEKEVFPGFILFEYEKMLSGR